MDRSVGLLRIILLPLWTVCQGPVGPCRGLRTLPSGLPTVPFALGWLLVVDWLPQTAILLLYTIVLCANSLSCYCHLGTLTTDLSRAHAAY